jgi:putative colanic acid biosynthesis acetyltransferase WcaF
MKVHNQLSPYDSPWTPSQRIKMMLWNISWKIFCSWTPKPFNLWRLFWVKVFGGKVFGKPFIHQRCRIQIPWNLIIHDKAAIGDRANIYSLGIIEILENATVAQEAYLCTGTHAFNHPTMNLLTSPIKINKNAFIGARAFIMPGIIIGENSIVGACSVVTKDVPDFNIVAGNPAHQIGVRNIVSN